MPASMAAFVLALCVASAFPAQAALRGPSPTKLTTDQKLDRLTKMGKQVSWHKEPVPQHIQAKVLHARTAVTNSSHVIRSMPVVELGGCGRKVLAKQLGVKKSKKAARAWKDASLLATSQHPGEDSFAKPGVGATQELADDGLSTTGSVGGEEAMVKVLKDGFFEVGCYFDSMLEFGDKFGDDKDKYGSKASSANVAVAKYKDLILKEDQVGVSPVVCFEFCRTLPGMVFFGIHNGDECYCTPYFTPQAGDDSNCDVPCAGSPTEMCGGAKGKSTIWEMHLCADGLEDLTEGLDKAKMALDYFYESASLAVDLGEKMTAAGDALEKAAGQSGSPKVADLGMAAKVAGGDLVKGYREGQTTYELMLAAHETGKEAEGEDFGMAAVASKAEGAVRTINSAEGKVLGFASTIHDAALDAYPATDFAVFGDEPASGDGVAAALDSDAKASDFRPAPYAFGETTDNEYQATTCYGPTLGAPKVGLGLNGCGLACEQTVSPTKCVAFASYKVGDTEDLCFLFSEVDGAEAFSCSSSLLEKQAGTKKGGDDAAAAVCKVKMSEMSTGYRPKGELKKVPRCFGSGSDKSVPEEMTSYSNNAGAELKVNDRVVLKQAA